MIDIYFNNWIVQIIAAINIVVTGVFNFLATISE